MAGSTRIFSRNVSQTPGPTAVTSTQPSRTAPSPGYKAPKVKAARVATPPLAPVVRLPPVAPSKTASSAGTTKPATPTHSIGSSRKSVRFADFSETGALVNDNSLFGDQVDQAPEGTPEMVMGPITGGSGSSCQPAGSYLDDLLGLNICNESTLKESHDDITGDKENEDRTESRQQNSQKETNPKEEARLVREMTTLRFILSTVQASGGASPEMNACFDKKLTKIEARLNDLRSRAQKENTTETTNPSQLGSLTKSEKTTTQSKKYVITNTRSPSNSGMQQRSLLGERNYKSRFVQIPLLQAPPEIRTSSNLKSQNADHESIAPLGLPPLPVVDLRSSLWKDDLVDPPHRPVGGFTSSSWRRSAAETIIGERVLPGVSSLSSIIAATKSPRRLSTTETLPAATFTTSQSPAPPSLLNSTAESKTSSDQITASFQRLSVDQPPAFVPSVPSRNSVSTNPLSNNTTEDKKSSIASTPKPCNAEPETAAISTRTNTVVPATKPANDTIKSTSSAAEPATSAKVLLGSDTEKTATYLSSIGVVSTITSSTPTVEVTASKVGVEHDGTVEDRRFSDVSAAEPAPTTSIAKPNITARALPNIPDNAITRQYARAKDSTSKRDVVAVTGVPEAARTIELTSQKLDNASSSPVMSSVHAATATASSDTAKISHGTNDLSRASPTIQNDPWTPPSVQSPIDTASFIANPQRFSQPFVEPRPFGLNGPLAASSNSSRSARRGGASTLSPFLQSLQQASSLPASGVGSATWLQYNQGSATHSKEPSAVGKVTTSSNSTPPPQHSESVSPMSTSILPGETRSSSSKRTSQPTSSAKDAWGKVRQAAK